MHQVLLCQGSLCLSLCGSGKWGKCPNKNKSTSRFFPSLSEPTNPERAFSTSRARSPRAQSTPRARPLPPQWGANPQRTFPPALSRAGREVAGAPRRVTRNRGEEERGRPLWRENSSPAPRIARSSATRAGRGSPVPRASAPARPTPPSRGVRGPRPAADSRAPRRLQSRPGRGDPGGCSASSPAARTSEAACQERIAAASWRRAQQSFPAPLAAAAAPRRNYAIRSRPGLSPPAGDSGNRAEKVAGVSRGLPSLTPREEQSAARRPRNPGSPPWAGRRARGPSHPRAGSGSAPQQSARGGKGARSRARPHRGLGPPRLLPRHRLPPPPADGGAPSRSGLRFPSGREGREGAMGAQVEWRVGPRCWD
jgi:hypothetical protein